MTAPLLKVGSPVWFLNDRHHRENRWQEVVITAETKLSWIAGRHNPIKLPKRDPHSFTRRDFGPSRVALSRAEVDEADFLDRHRYRIGAAVGRINDPAMLRKIAEMIGYPEKT